MFENDNKDYAENMTYWEYGDYMQSFYVFSWIENKEIQTYDVLIDYVGGK